MFDKRTRALAQARFRAWWEGEEFDESIAKTVLELQSAPTGAGALDEDLFARSQSAPRLAALALIWGEGRIMPGDATSEALHPARLGIPESGRLIVMGAGLAAPLVVLAEKHEGPILALEWRETRAACEEGLPGALLGRVDVRAAELDAFSAMAESCDGFMSFDEFTYAADARRLAREIAKALRPDVCAAIECYTAQAFDCATAFATGFAAPHLRAPEELARIFSDAGFIIEAAENQSDEHAELARAGFKRLEKALAAAVERGLSVHILREIAWETEAWSARLKLMTQNRLQRRQWIVRKR